MTCKKKALIFIWIILVVFFGIYWEIKQHNNNHKSLDCENWYIQKLMCGSWPCNYRCVMDIDNFLLSWNVKN